MSNDIHHEETYTHKSGKKYNVRWYYDYDFGAPLDESDCHGVVKELDWNPTNSEQLEQHIADEEPEVEEVARLSLMRRLTYRGRSDNDLYYDVMASLHKAKHEWGVEPDRCMEVVEKDFAYLKGWYDDDWFWLTIGVAPVTIDEDGDEIIDEDERQFCGGYESTVLGSDEENTKWRDEIINDQILSVEHQLRRANHPNQMELEV